MSDAYRHTLGINARDALVDNVGIFNKQWGHWDPIRQRLEPHENMNPLLQLVGRMNRSQIKDARNAHAAHGYLTSPAQVKEAANPAALAMFGNKPSKAALAILGPLLDKASDNGPQVMDKASRLARAKALGFDPNTVWKHGTSAGKFDQFELGKPGASAEIGRPGLTKDVVMLTTSGQHAAKYGSVGDYLTRGNFLRVNEKRNLEKWARSEGYKNAQDAIDQYGSIYDAGNLDDTLSHWKRLAQKAGYDGVRLNFGRLKSQGKSVGDILQVFDPKNIRSTEAAFDPSLSDSSNLLASNRSQAGLPALLSEALMQGQDPIPVKKDERLY
jgi:hypothetical protein